jgi:hypothetical protein
MQNKDKGNSNTNCTFKWHLVFWVTIGSNTNLHLALINLFSVACPLILAKYNNLPLKDSQPITEYLHYVEDFNIKYWLMFWKHANSFKWHSFKLSDVLIELAKSPRYLFNSWQNLVPIRHVEGVKSRELKILILRNSENFANWKARVYDHDCFVERTYTF